MDKKLYDIDELINRLEHTKQEDVGQEEIKKLLDEEELCSYGRLIRETSEVFARESSSAPDAKIAWKQFKRQKIRRDNHRKQLLIWSSVATVAAGIALFFFFKNPVSDTIQSNPPIPVAVVPYTQNITITTESGEQQILGVKQSDSLLIAKGIEVDNKSINYRNTEKEEKQTLNIPRGQDFKITLSDGTEIWLNAESTLTYPSKFNGTERVVELVGEGYFKVAKDKEHPFIVHANTLSTRVSGTEFNMRAYHDNTPHVTLVEGKVHVKTMEQDQEIELSPGEDASMDSNGWLIVQNVDTYSYVQWKNGYFYFDDAPLEDVIHELERWYNVRFEVKDSSILPLRIHYVANRREDITKAIENLNTLGLCIVTMGKDRIIIDKH